MANFINSKRFAPSGFYLSNYWGLGVLGRTEVVRATPGPDPECEGEYCPDIDGHAMVLVEVFDWPHSTDDNGFSFPGGLKGVRTKCTRKAGYNGDDFSDLIAVPQTIPSGYTNVGRCGQIVNLIDDYFDGRGLPMEVRTKTKILPTHADNAEWHARSNWIPQQRGTASNGSGLVGQKSVLATNHIGYRAGQMEFFKGNGIDSGSDTYSVGYIPDDASSIPAPGDSGWVSTGSITVSYTSSDFNTVESKTMPAILPPAGKTCWLAVWITDDVTYQSSLKSFKAPTRVDVPLWFFASTKNKCVQGGVVLS